MSLWDSLFGHLRQPVAQILLTRNDIADVSDREIGETFGIHVDKDSVRNISMPKIHSSNCSIWE